MAGRVPTWTLDFDAEMLREIHLKAASPSDQNTQFLAATCLLLLVRFENPNRGSDFQWEWDTFAPIYRNADNTVRAAIMNGFEHARRYSLVSEDVRPKPSDRVTNLREDVLAPLIHLAKSLTNEERERIATADYGHDIKKHFDALNALLESETCLYPFGEVWYPAEVIELVSHSEDSPGFAGCTAIMLVNAIYDNDSRGNADYRWTAHRLSYDVLEGRQRKVIHGGFRYVYEANQDWDPYWEEFAPERLPTNSFLPL